MTLYLGFNSLVAAFVFSSPRSQIMLIENAIVIPARLESTRLPRKLLLEYKGKPLIQHAVEQALGSTTAQKVILLYDDERLFKSVEYNNQRLQFYNIKQAENGTHRLQQFIKLEQEDGIYYRNIVLLQADILNCNTGYLVECVFNVLSHLDKFGVSTLSYPLMLSEQENESIVKLIPGDSGVAQYFTRKYVPGAKKHIGIYGFANILMNKFEYDPYLTTPENLEQLNWIFTGHTIRFSDLGFLKPEDLGKSIDTKEDYDELCRNT